MNQDEFTRRLLSGAVVNLEAARVVVSNATMDLWPAVFQLLGLSVELALKAFLVSRGCGEGECLKIGHDLLRAAREATVRGMPSLTPELLGFLEHINPAYRGHEVRYLRGGAIEIVDEFQALVMVKTLVRHIGDAIPVSKLLITQ